MTIYHYDRDIFELKSESHARENPREKGDFLIPAFATVIAPPKAKKGYTPVFDEATQKWAQVIDNRGVVKYWHGEKVIFKLGDEITAEMTDEQYTPAELLQQAKTQKKEALNRSCEASIEAGFMSDAMGTSHFYPSQRDDQLNLIGIASAAALNNKSKVFKCKEVDTGEVHWHLHTPLQLEKLLEDAEDFKITRLMHCGTLKQKVQQAQSVKEVEAIVWTEPTKTQVKAYLNSLKKAALKSKK